MRIVGTLLLLLLACSDDDEREPAPATHDLVIDPATLPSHGEPVAAQQVAPTDPTRGAIEGEVLARFVPASLGGLARTHATTQAYAAAGAYALPGGGWANLDVQATFPALGSGAGACTGRAVTARGYDGCALEAPDRFSVRWPVGERVVVVLAGPDEATVMGMAADVDFDGLAALPPGR